MMSWGFPSIHVAVAFSSVLQVLFIMLGYKRPYIHRCPRKHHITFGGKPDPQAKIWKLSTSSSCQTEVGGHIATSREPV